MPDYRRMYVPGGTVFLTLVTYERSPIFASEQHVHQLRLAVKHTQAKFPFDIVGAVIMPDHIHFIWQLPDGDSDYPKRVSCMKKLFTQSIRNRHTQPTNISPSRRKKRESNVWHRRYYERTLRDEQALSRCLDYIHYNPVKHGYTQCPHHWALLQPTKMDYPR